LEIFGRDPVILEKITFLFLVAKMWKKKTSFEGLGMTHFEELHQEPLERANSFSNIFPCP
jgi:hypothetical protein